MKLPMKLLLPQTRTTDPQEQSNDERRLTIYEGWIRSAILKDRIETIP